VKDGERTSANNRKNIVLGLKKNSPSGNRLFQNATTVPARQTLLLKNRGKLLGRVQLG